MTLGGWRCISELFFTGSESDVICALSGMHCALGAAIGHETGLLEVEVVLAAVPVHAEDVNARRARLRLQCVDDDRPGGRTGGGRGCAAVVGAVLTVCALREVRLLCHATAVLSDQNRREHRRADELVVYLIGARRYRLDEDVFVLDEAGNDALLAVDHSGEQRAALFRNISHDVHRGLLVFPQIFAIVEAHDAVKLGAINLLAILC